MGVVRSAAIEPTSSARVSLEARCLTAHLHRILGSVSDASGVLAGNLALVPLRYDRTRPNFIHREECVLPLRRLRGVSMPATYYFSGMVAAAEQPIVETVLKPVAEPTGTDAMRVRFCRTGGIEPSDRAQTGPWLLDSQLGWIG